MSLCVGHRCFGFPTGGKTVEITSVGREIKERSLQLVTAKMNVHLQDMTNEPLDHKKAPEMQTEEPAGHSFLFIC